MSEVGNIALLVFAGAGFTHLLTWLLHIHTHHWTYGSHACGRRLGFWTINACLHCTRCGARRYAATNEWFDTKEAAMVWLRAQCSGDAVPDHLPEQIEAPKSPGSAA